MPDVEIISWDGCYDGQWGSLIHDDAYCHPAKFASGLIIRIFKYMMAEGMLKKGDTVVDPFGGIGSGGVIAAGLGLRWIGCELEPKFHALGQQNFAMHRDTWLKFGDPLPVIVQGDSRKLRENLRWHLATLQENTPHGADSVNIGKEKLKPARPDSLSGSSEADGNVSAGNGCALNAQDCMPAAIVSSPPYNLPMSQDHNGSCGGQRGTVPSEEGAFVKYGNTPGQLEGLPMGDVNAIVCSPPFSDPGSQPAGNMPSTPVRSKQKAMGLEKKAGEEYGATPGQLGQLKVGDVSAVICSPPFADRQPAANARPSDDVKLSTIQADTYGETEGQLGTMEIGELDSIVSSPPYAECLKGDNTAKETAAESQAKRITQGGSLGQSQRHAGYGSAENLGNLPAGTVDAIATSPPFEGCEPCQDDKFKINDGRKTPPQGQGGYGETTGQLGNEEPATFWAAARDIVRESYLILKPGGFSAWVVKSFIRDGKIVDFPGDWHKLLESQGFIVTTHVHAMLVKHDSQPGLFDETVTKTKKRSSFFRRIYEKRFPQNAIDFEVVIFARKPCDT